MTSVDVPTPERALAFLNKELRQSQRPTIYGVKPPQAIFSGDPEVQCTPVVLLDTPLNTLAFILNVLVGRMGSDLQIEIPHDEESRELSDEWFDFAATYMWPGNAFFWANVKFDQFTGVAPLKTPQTPHPFAGFAVLTALACHPARVREMIRRPETGLWIPGISVAPRHASEERQKQALAAKGNVLRIGKNRRFFDPRLHASRPASPPLLLASAPGDMMDGHYRVPTILTR